MNITKLIELNDKAHEVLGWRAGGSIDLGYNVEEVGDLVLYLEIHDSVMQTSDILETFEGIKSKLETLFGRYAGGVDFFQDEKSQSGYSVAIPLANFSTDYAGERKP